MKVKITRPDGTVIEAEGTAEECGKLIGGEASPIPSPSPSPYPFWLQPIYPWYPGYPITYPVYPSYPVYSSREITISPDITTPVPVITTPTWTTLGTTGVVFGGPVGPSGFGWTTGAISLDFTEPAPVRY